MIYKHTICIGDDEDLGRGLSCFTCVTCGKSQLTQNPYKPTLRERLSDRIRGIDLADFTTKKISGFVKGTK